MGKRKNQKGKRSINRLPKGLPVRPNSSHHGKNVTTASGIHSNNNPFEQTHRQNKRAKFEVVNRPTTSRTNNHQTTTSALAQALTQRQKAVRDVLRQKGKANVFDDKRIGASAAAQQSQQQQDATLARLVRERTRRSKRARQFNLEDDDGEEEEAILTHRGKAIDPKSAASHVLLSDDEDDDDNGGNLDAYDTELHFGGGAIGSKRNKEASIYGNSSAKNTAGGDLSTQYAHKKTDLDDLIMRRKIAKAERLQSKEQQLDTFTAMDEQFGELSQLLQFRDKEQDSREHWERKRAGTLPREDREMAEWDQEMKQYLYATTRRVKAQDRTQTLEEIAREEAERLHALETRRLARMNGEFEDDDEFSDVDESDSDNGEARKKKQKNRDHPEALDNDSSDDEDGDPNKLTTRFTADGLVQVDRNGVIVGKFGEVQTDETSSAKKQENDGGDGDDDAAAATVSLAVGAEVTASYRANEQFDGNETWFSGTVSAVHKDNREGRNNTISYDIEYDDGDFEEGVEPRHVRPVEKTADELQKEAAVKQEAATLQRKRQKAREKARSEIPFVLEVPTTLDALHDMIANYATTGKDASLIVQRIHKTNSVRLDRRNADKMQNFFDVLIRRFVAVGDAIHVSGNGGAELGRYAQLDVLTQTMYAMAQESPDMAGAVWSRRLGFFQNAHAKRLRDAALSREEDGEDEFTAWPSTGVVLALRALGHIFPVTDKRHYVVTPAILLLGQMIGHTPLLSRKDLVLGTMCCGLLIEYTREAKRVAPEAHAFLSSIIRLFAPNAGKGRHSFPLPTFQAAATIEPFSTLRAAVSAGSDLGDLAPQLSLELEAIKGDDMPAALLFVALHLVEISVKNLAGSVSSAEKEVFAEITESVLALNESKSSSKNNSKKKKSDSLPVLLRNKIASVAQTLATALDSTSKRAPLQRRASRSTVAVVKSLAPRLENPERYSMSKDKGKNATQAAADRARREYKREHKAVSRELQLDGAAMEQERRRSQHNRDAAAKAKRHKAFAWLEAEQGVMNQQVRQGGGLLQGGGMGAARAAAKSGKFGVKKGGKFR